MDAEVEFRHINPTEEVRDQGELHTCLSHATSTAHRGHRENAERLSAETLHYYANDEDFTSGTSFEKIQQILLEQGQPEDRHCESVETNQTEWSPPVGVEYFKSESQVEDPLNELLKEKIREEKLPILGITFPDQFYNPQEPWIVSSGEPRGAHAVVGVGLAKYDQDIIVMIQNSWGIQWANQGIAYLDDNFLEEHLQEFLILSPGMAS